MNNQKFQDFFDWSRDNVAEITWEGRQKELATRFPTAQEQNAYKKWQKKHFAKLQKAFEFLSPERAITRDKLVHLVKNTNFNSDEHRNRLTGEIQQNIVPWIGVGRADDGRLFRIAPGAYGLISDKKDHWEREELLDENVLGVNLDVQPRLPTSRRTANLSEESANSNESDDIGEGFVFFQLGLLETVRPDKPPQNSKDAARASWYSTKFCAVIRIRPNGTQDGIYIIWNFNPMSEDESDERRRIDDEHWGYLPSASNQRISVAKIANKLDELKWNRNFKLEVLSTRPVELVGCKKTAMGSIIRAYVA